MDYEAELAKFQDDLRRLLTYNKDIGLSVEDLATTTEYVLEDSDWTIHD
jgi:hypothetical protein